MVYAIINPVFSNTHCNLEIASNASHVLSDNSDSEVSNGEETELIDFDEGLEADESTSNYHFRLYRKK